MSDPDNTGREYGGAEPHHPPLRQPFPFTRLIYAIGFAIVAWFVFWTLILLAAVQFITIAITGHVNDELRQFTRSVILYLAEILTYVAMIGDETPFPFKPFPKA